MFCNQCGSKLLAGGKFCRGCGAPVIINEIKPEAKNVSQVDFKKNNFKSKGVAKTGFSGAKVVLCATILVIVLIGGGLAIRAYRNNSFGRSQLENVIGSGGGGGGGRGNGEDNEDSNDSSSERVSRPAAERDRGEPLPGELSVYDTNRPITVRVIAEIDVATSGFERISAIGSFHDGIAIVTGGSVDEVRYGYIDMYGNMILKDEYQAASIFSEGLAYVRKSEQTHTGLVWEWVEAEAGYINTDGQLVMDFTGADNTARGVFQDGLAPYYSVDRGARGYSFDSTHIGFMNTQGALAFSFQRSAYDGIGYTNREGGQGFFREGFMPVYLSGAASFIDTTGQPIMPIIDYSFEHASLFSEGLAAVRKDGKWGYIDTTGNVIIPFEYDPLPGAETAGAFSDGVVDIRKNGEKMVIDKNGDQLFTHTYAEPLLFYNGISFATPRAVYTYDEQVYLINKSNEVLMEMEYITRLQDSTRTIFCDGLAKVFEINESRNYIGGYMDTSGTLIVPIEFMNTSDRPLNNFNEGLAAVRKHGDLNTWYILQIVYADNNEPAFRQAVTPPVDPGTIKPPDINYFTVIFDLEGGTHTGGGELSQTVQEGHSAIAPVAEREGYDFVDWDKAFANILADTEIKATWALKPPGPPITSDTGPTTPDTGPITPDTGPITPGTGPIKPEPVPITPTPAPVAQVDTLIGKWRAILDSNPETYYEVEFASDGTFTFVSNLPNESTTHKGTYEVSGSQIIFRSNHTSTNRTTEISLGDLASGGLTIIGGNTNLVLNTTEAFSFDRGSLIMTWQNEGPFTFIRV